MIANPKTSIEKVLAVHMCLFLPSLKNEGAIWVRITGTAN